eukprot:1157637-Pelagomonas_calceolata.AAC.13
MPEESDCCKKEESKHTGSITGIQTSSPAGGPRPGPGAPFPPEHNCKPAQVMCVHAFDSQQATMAKNEALGMAVHEALGQGVQ